MSTKPKLFAELCCGSAAVTLRLLGGSYAKPPVSYTGSKRGYAEAILSVLGLRAGQGADAVLLCDPGPWSSVWRVLSTPDGCREVAKIIRGWAGEEPRALWERLRAEGPLSGKEGAAQYVTLSASNRLINADWKEGRWANTGKGGTTFGGEEFATPATEVEQAVSALERIAWPREVAGYLAEKYLPHAGGGSFKTTAGGHWPETPPKLEAMDLGGGPWPPTAILSSSAMAIDPREVAAWLLTHRWSFSEKGPEHGYGGPGCEVRTTSSTWTTEGRDAALEREPLARRIEGLPRMPDALVAQDARAPAPERLPEGCYAYIDGPYENTTGYTHQFPRPDQIEVARRWDDAGAIVCISEAEPLSIPGWHHVEITEERVGQARTFSKQKREFLTLNRPPAVRFDGQSSMFAVGAVAPKPKPTLGFSFPDLEPQPEPLEGQPSLFGEEETPRSTAYYDDKAGL